MDALASRILSNRMITGWASSIIGESVPIFMLHRPQPEDGTFQGISEHFLDECLAAAVRLGYEFISLDDLVAHALSDRVDRLSKPLLCFTLDDGYADQVSRLVPVLLKYRAKPTLFVVTDFIDGKDWLWDAKLAYAVKHTPLPRAEFTFNGARFSLHLETLKQKAQSRRHISAYAKGLAHTDLHSFVSTVAASLEVELPAQAPDDYKPASWQTLTAMEKQGLILGSHTCSHHVLNALPDEMVLKELIDSRARLGAMADHPSGVFCYPSGTAGDFSPHHQAIVRQAGYAAAVSTLSQPAFLSEVKKNPFAIHRIGFPSSIRQFMRYSSWVEALRSRLPV